MKKIISILLVLVIALGALALTGCKGRALEFGLGVYTSVSATDATEEKAGEANAAVTVAAVLLDKDGKIVKAAIDCADSTVGYTDEGKAQKAGEFKTKYEQGADYGMKTYAGSAKEWYEQVDAFCELVVGKTADDLAGLVAADYKGTEDVINAGCTIYVSDFVKALEAAIENATESEATKNSTLKIGMSTNATPTDATAEALGSNTIETTIFAAALDENGKVVAASADCVEASFTFDLEGKSKFDTKDAVLSKRQKGDNYGMKEYAGSAKEWYEQADAFCQSCLGKTVSEIEVLMGSDGKGNADIQAAGCTIYVSGFVKAAAKIG